MTGMVRGGWEFVIAAYAVTALILLGYLVSVVLRHRQERSRRLREPADDRPRS